MTDFSANFPDITTPIIGADGRVNPIWLQFLLRLYVRTSGSTGNDGRSAEAIARASAALIQSIVAPPTPPEADVNTSVQLPPASSHNDALLASSVPLRDYTTTTLAPLLTY